MLFIFIFSMPQVRAFAAQNKIKILQASGDISDLSQDSKISTWNKKSWIADRLALKLKEGAYTKIQLNPEIVLTAYGGTEFMIPAIGWESREFRELKLTQGVIRLEIQKVPFEFELSTPFFKVRLPAGIWVFKMDPERALVDILSFKGNLELTSLNSDEKANLKTGESVTFRGVLEENEISYDLLLEGRKIPKGKWLSVEKISQDYQQKYSLEAEKKRFDKERRQQHRAQSQKLKRQAGELCVNPPGNLGECVWKKQKNECIRTRCAADGKWKDPQVMGNSFCDRASGGIAEPKECDY